ncbi:MAG: hypothetical protein J6B29_05980 [Clostridia bacterium]|nr:hypothetical protein [Clostridia bacterium]
MSKDPAVLLYTSDFLAEVCLMSDQEVGMYIKLLCLQHQRGHLKRSTMETACGGYNETVFDMFITDEDGLYYNERLQEESDKRQAFSESRRRNCTSKRQKAEAKTEETASQPAEELMAEKEEAGTSKDALYTEVETRDIRSDFPLIKGEAGGTDSGFSQGKEEERETNSGFSQGKEEVMGTNNGFSRVKEEEREIKGSFSQGKEGEKKAYGRYCNVYLTDAELDSLRDEFPYAYMKKIDDLSYYIRSKGAKYQSHYATIISWDRRSNPSQKDGKAERIEPTFDPDDFFQAAIERTNRELNSKYGKKE